MKRRDIEDFMGAVVLLGIGWVVAVLLLSLHP